MGEDRSRNCGAIIENKRRQKVTTNVIQSDKHIVKECVSACLLCGAYCGIILSLNRNDKIVKIVGDKKNPRSKGFICNKGVNLYTSLDSPHRLTKPLKRIDGNLVEVSWDEALKGIGEELKRIRKDYSGRSIGLALGGSMHSTMQHLVEVLMLKALGSRNCFGPPSNELLSKYLVNQKMYGLTFFDGCADYENSRYIIIMGSNPIVSIPLHGPVLKKAGKSKDQILMVVDPRKTETAELADIHLPIQPSTDIYFLLALLNVIISGEHYDKRHVDKYSVGINDVKSIISTFTPEFAEQHTGISAKLIETTAIEFAQAESAVIEYDLGVIINVHSTLSSWAVQTLLFITNNICRPGGSIVIPSPMEFDDPAPKYQTRVRNKKHEEIGGFLPTGVLQDEILTRGEGQIRAMIVAGGNPLRGYTDSAKMERAFDDLELIVSIDPFLTEVGRKAHYVLPACMFQEQENISFGVTWVFLKPHLQLLEKFRDPLGESWPEWKICKGILKHAGTVQGVDNKIIQSIFSGLDFVHKLCGKQGEYNRQQGLSKMVARMMGTSYKEMKQHPHGFSKPPKKEYNYFDSLKTKDKKVHLAIPEFLSSLDQLHQDPVQDNEFPLRLSTTCRTMANINTMYRNTPWQEKNQHENFLVIHPDDVEGMNVSDNDQVKLISKTNEDLVRISLSTAVLPGSIYLSHGWGLITRDPNSVEVMPGIVAGKFVSDIDGDEFTGMPFYNGIPCRIEKA